MERGGKRGGGKRGGGPGRGPARGRGRGRDDQPGQEPPRPGEGQDVSFMQSMQQRAAQAAQQQQPQAAQQQQPQAAQQQQPQATQPQPQAQRGGGVQRRGGKRAPAAAQQMAPGAVAAGEPLDMGAVQKALPPVPEMAVVPKRTAFPQRPKHGQLGRAIQLVANHFEIELPHGDVYHYDVAIVSPSKKEEAKAPDQKKMRCLSTRINRLVIQNLVAKYRGELNKCLPAFDGRKNLYTRKPLPFKERTFKVPFQEGDREQEFIVTVQYAATVSLDALHAVYDRHVRTVPQEVIQALDIIMRHGPCVTLTPVGRSIFMPPAPGDNSELGGGHEVWFGYYTSVRPAQWKPMLNIDRSATAFYEAIPVIEFMCKLLSEGPAGAPYQRPENFRRLTASQCIKLSKELKDLRVRVLHLSYPRKYKVAKVTQLSAQELNFNLDAGTKTNVAEYFRQKYPKYMRYPNLPCIQAGTPNRPVYLPLEACHIVEGQPYRKKLSESMTTEMIRRTAQPPAQRFRSIMSSVRDVVDKSRPYLDEFGIKVSTNPTQLKGRVLDPPSLTFGGEQTLRPRDGVWDLRNSRLLAAKAIDKWALLGVNCRLDPGAINNMVHLFKDIGGKLGMMVKDPLFARSEPTGRTPIVKVLKELKDNKVELVIIVLGRQASYADIKEAAEVKLGIRTQCIKEFNMTRKCNPALITNLCLKINAKLGGTNNGLLSQEKPAIFKEPVIIIGADVTHPAPGDRVKPSIAACVGSMDSIPSRYQASIRVQIQKEEAVARVEIIEDLKDMIKELLKAFYLETRHKPVRIIFYRDGVSEGQFGIVRDQELSAIRQACLELSPDGSYKPPVTFIVVQKRHHTRFMPANERDGVGRAKNIPPGTTVDTVVTHPVDFDFFLCSHAGIQGTSKPAHYYVVHDDANFTSDDLQKLSYYLCHTYARCARSVSIPAPVYYAHLAAFRAKEHIASACNISSGSSVSSAGSDSVSTEQYVSAVKVTEAMQKHMYFV